MVRIQLDLPEDQVEVLDRLMEETKIRTRKDLFNNSLTLFEWAVKAKQAGLSICSLDEKTGRMKEIVMPALQNAQVSQKEEPVGAGN